MVSHMNIDDRIISELKRYNNINKYVVEQAAGEAPTDTPPVDAGLDTGLGGEPATETPPAPDTAPSTPVDTATDPDVEKLDDSGKPEEKTQEESGTEELDITDLVTSQKSIESKQDEYFQNLFTHLENLENKLAEMDKIVDQLNKLEGKVESMRPKTPQEKLELRSLDSFPFNQKLTDFFDDKQEDMRATGKNEYVITTDDVEEYSPMEIRKTFNDYDHEAIPTKY